MDYDALALPSSMSALRKQKPAHRLDPCLRLPGNDLLATLQVVDEGRVEQKRLHAQINHHFLLNALNGARALLRKDADQSWEMMTKLAEYLRYVLTSTDTREVMLAEEVDSVRRYLDFEKMRYKDDLQCTFSLDPRANHVLIPPLLIQPLVENAVRYGMGTGALPLRLQVSSVCRDQKLRLEVANTGCWVPPGQAETTGIGLYNVRRRLKSHYLHRHRLVIFEQEGWVHAIIEITL